MKCKVCGHAMVLLLTSWACDHCDGKDAPVSCSASGPARELWLALFGPGSIELRSKGYRRAKIKLFPVAKSSDWQGTATFPAATGDWDVSRAFLCDSEVGGKIIVNLDLNWGATVRSGDQLTAQITTSLP